MREYLINNKGEYELHQGGIVPDGAIEVPNGAIKAFKNHGDSINFVNSDDDYMNGATNGLWVNTHRGKHESSGHELVWSRTPSLNDQYAEIEKVRHAHYFKDVSDIDEIDVYEVLHRFGVTDPCLQHIVKKALCAGERGHKDFHTDLKNIADTAQRMLEIHGL